MCLGKGQLHTAGSMMLWVGGQVYNADEDMMRTCNFRFHINSQKNHSSRK